MNYEEFLSDIRLHLKKKIKSGCKLQIHKMQRNNGTYYDGLVILCPGRNVSPTIYLTPYYHRYLNGVSLEDIYDDILETYRRTLPEKDFDSSLFTDFKKARSGLVMRLVDRARNEDLLSQVPHIHTVDLAIIFYYLVAADAENQASILVRNEHLDLWGIDTETLYHIAEENTPALLPHQLISMQELLFEYESTWAEHLADEGTETEHLTDEGIETDLLTDEGPSMYILSNRFRTNGAAAILYEGLLSSIADKFRSNLIILPSSIHEVILIPVEDDRTLAECSRMVREVNASQLADDEILSDHAYYYDRGKEQIIA